MVKLCQIVDIFTGDKTMIRAKNISKGYGPVAVLSDVSFAIERGQRIALVGHNGTGKSTLLKILAGLEDADSGGVEASRSVRIGYLPQDTSLAGSETIEVYLRRVTGVDAIEREMEELSGELQDPRLKVRFGELQELFVRMEGYTFSYRMEVMLTGFGLTGVELDRSLAQLSSGQKSKVSLIGILHMEADILLLDEPTNNLDIPALIWLEDFLEKSSSACLVISHDRRFLDRVASKVMELDWRTHEVTLTGGNYSDYLAMKAKEAARHREQYRLQQEEIGRLSTRAQELKRRAQQGSRWVGSDNDKFVRGMKRDSASGSGRAAKAIEKRIDQMAKVERPINRDALQIPLEADKSQGGLEISLVDVVAGYLGSFSVGPVSFTARFGERIGIMGLNGSGKSTLLKTITGHLQPLSGKVLVGSGLKIGDMMQEHDSLPRDLTPAEFIESKMGDPSQNPFGVLAKFGIEVEQAKKPIGVLSPGGRARLLLALFAALSVSVLVLDEPTNHLDLEALDALEEALSEYEGTVLLVSHDRYFLESALLDWTFLLEGGELSRIEDFRVYVASAEERARKLLRFL